VFILVEVKNLEDFHTFTSALECNENLLSPPCWVRTLFFQIAFAECTFGNILIKEERTLKENKKTHDYGIRNSRFNFRKFNTQ
jgi:hypothetical protein